MLEEKKADIRHFPYICHFLMNNQSTYIIKIFHISYQKQQEKNIEAKFGKNVFLLGPYQLINFQQDLSYQKQKKINNQHNIKKMYVYCEKGICDTQVQFESIINELNKLKKERMKMKQNVKNEQQLQKNKQQINKNKQKINQLFKAVLKAGCKSLQFLKKNGIQQNDIKLKNFLILQKKQNQGQTSYKIVLIDFNHSTIINPSLRVSNISLSPQIQFENVKLNECNQKSVLQSNSYQNSKHFQQLNLYMKVGVQKNDLHPLLLGKLDGQLFAWCLFRLLTMDKIQKIQRVQKKQKKNIQNKQLIQQINGSFKKIYRDYQKQFQKQKQSSQLYKTPLKDIKQNYLKQFTKKFREIVSQKKINLFIKDIKQKQKNQKIQNKIIDLIASAMIPITQFKTSFNQLTFQFKNILDIKFNDDLLLEDQQAQYEKLNKNQKARLILNEIMHLLAKICLSIKRIFQQLKQNGQQAQSENIKNDCLLYMTELEKDKKKLQKEMNQKNVSYKYKSSLNSAQLDIKYLCLLDQIKYFMSKFPKNRYNFDLRLFFENNLWKQNIIITQNNQKVSIQQSKQQYSFKKNK